MTSKFFIAASSLALAACASGGRQAETPGPTGPAASLDQSGRLLKHAREAKADKGCAEAIPTYRVIASFGEGYEVAQYELGACLLDIVDESDIQARLFNDEGILWLRRAAWAGNARAQWRLATTLSGAGDEALPTPPNPIEALGWAHVYKSNAAHELYGLAPISTTILAHLGASLTDEQKAAAVKFSDDFVEMKMAVFTPPGRPQGAREGRDFQPAERQQRRRRADVDASL